MRRSKIALPGECFVMQTTTQDKMKVDEVILNVLRFFEKEKKRGKLYLSLNRTRDRACAALGISRGRLQRVLRQDNHNVIENEAASKTGRPTKVDNFNLEVIRREVTNKLQRGEIVNLVSLRRDIGQRDINISLTTLRLNLNQLGFNYTRNDKSKCGTEVTERDDILTWRRHYLRRLAALRSEGRPIVYLDETWVNAGHAPTKEWCSSDVKRKRKVEPGRGGRWIIVDAGGANGFIDGASLVFRSKSGTGDYHAEMDGPRFERWFTEQLLPGLPQRGVIVMDNAPYHSVMTEESRSPGAGSKKEELRSWLTAKGIATGDDMLRAELAALVKQHRPAKKYKVDVLAEEAGHTVLRLPPYHCDLNPIEMVWAIEKGHVATNNTTQGMENVHQLFLAGRQKVADANLWPAFVRHVTKVEKRYWTADGLRDGQLVPPVILNPAEDSGEENNNEDSESDDEDDVEAPAPPPARIDRCPECGRGEEEEDEALGVVWFGCDGCELWWHRDCLDSLSNARIAASFRNSSQSWLCEVCLVRHLQSGDTSVLPAILDKPED